MSSFLPSCSSSRSELLSMATALPFAKWILVKMWMFAFVLYFDGEWVSGNKSCFFPVTSFWPTLMMIKASMIKQKFENDDMNSTVVTPEQLSDSFEPVQCVGEWPLDNPRSYLEHCHSIISALGNGLVSTDAAIEHNLEIKANTPSANWKKCSAFFVWNRHECVISACNTSNEDIYAKKYANTHTHNQFEVRLIANQYWLWQLSVCKCSWPPRTYRSSDHVHPTTTTTIHRSKHHFPTAPPSKLLHSEFYFCLLLGELVSVFSSSFASGKGISIRAQRQRQQQQQQNFWTFCPSIFPASSASKRTMWTIHWDVLNHFGQYNRPTSSISANILIDPWIEQMIVLHFWSASPSMLFILCVCSPSS